MTDDQGLPPEDEFEELDDIVEVDVGWTAPTLDEAKAAAILDAVAAAAQPGPPPFDPAWVAGIPSWREDSGPGVMDDA
jgi:hypothetical protein